LIGEALTAARAKTDRAQLSDIVSSEVPVCFQEGREFVPVEPLEIVEREVLPRTRELRVDLFSRFIGHDISFVRSSAAYLCLLKQGFGTRWTKSKATSRCAFCQYPSVATIRVA
jgi:hypothetical protein